MMAMSNISDDGKVKQSRPNQTTLFRGGSKKKSKTQTTISTDEGYGEEARGGSNHNSSRRRQWPECAQNRPVMARMCGQKEGKVTPKRGAEGRNKQGRPPTKQNKQSQTTQTTRQNIPHLKGHIQGDHDSGLNHSQALDMTVTNRYQTISDSRSRIKTEEVLASTSALRQTRLRPDGRCWLGPTRKSRA